MSAKLELRGFDDLIRDLTALPATLNHGADPILLRYARQAEAQLVAAYPVVTGALRGGVKIVERTARGVATLYTLVSSAPHAHLFEFGTARTTPRATFLPITERDRRAATAAVSDLVRDQGLTVHGDRT
jgi:hypothetical protein